MDKVLLRTVFVGGAICAAAMVAIVAIVLAHA